MNRGSTLLIAAAAMVSATPSIAKDESQHLFGPPPSWPRFEALAAAALQGRLIDPESARLTWAGGYFKGAFKPFLSPRVEGYVGCGHVNARNRMGGYAGATAFVVVVDYDRVIYASIADPRLDGVSIQCAKALEKGLIPPLPPVASPDTPIGSAAQASAATPSGLTVRAMPEGAYIVAVTEGSAAAAAGLKPGMVIATVNAIPLAGMGDAMTKVVGAAAPGATVTLIGGATLTLLATK